MFFINYNSFYKHKHYVIHQYSSLILYLTDADQTNYLYGLGKLTAKTDYQQSKATYSYSNSKRLLFLISEKFYTALFVLCVNNCIDLPCLKESNNMNVTASPKVLMLYQETQPFTDPHMFSIFFPTTVGTPPPGCQYNEDCPTNLACDRLSRTCIDPCRESGCAPTAICTAVNHRADCRCPDGYTGNPIIECAIRK